MTNLLSPEWVARLSTYPSLILGFSGGLDSTVLVHALAAEPTLRQQLLAVHVNHQLSPNAKTWQAHCAEFCAKHKIPFATQAVTLTGTGNREEEARQLRYQILSSYLKTTDCLVLAHHCDDQAETLLLQLFRGAGVEGLSAMKALHTMPICIARPFLPHTRAQLHTYALKHQLTWIEDESNDDLKLSRNYLRHQIIPLLQNKWPSLNQTLARTARHCQDAGANLEDLALFDCPELAQVSRSLGTVHFETLNSQRIANILRVWLKKNQIQLPSTARLQAMMDELLSARKDAMPLVTLGTQKIRRYRDRLYLLTEEHSPSSSLLPWPDFPKPLLLPSQAILTAERVAKGLRIPSGAMLEIGWRQGGEHLIWHGQTKTLKTLFQEWGIPPWQRAQIPLIYINGELAAVSDIAISDLFYAEGDCCWVVKGI